MSTCRARRAPTAWWRRASTTPSSRCAAARTSGSARAAARQTAKALTQEYIKRRVKDKLLRQVSIVLVETGLLLFAFFLNLKFPSLLSELFASLVLWGVTLYNVIDLLFCTIPELVEVHKVLKGKIGYTLKYFLKISVITELMEANIVFLAICLSLAISSRTVIGTHFSYVKPWKKLIAPYSNNEQRKSGRHEILKFQSQLAFGSLDDVVSKFGLNDA